MGSPQTGQRMDSARSTGLLVLISAPSGGGKTTLCEQLVASDDNVARAITCTTRPPREGERDGVDYFFLEPAVFRRRLAEGEFLEHATVHGNLYGTLRSAVEEKLRQGQDVLLSIDVQGAASIRTEAARSEALKQALVSVFVTPASLSMLEERLRKRGKDTSQEIAKRLQAARQEISHWMQYDYLIISRSVAEDLRRMQAILVAERIRTRRVPAPWSE